jgi:trimeric autotransporter adhesin
MSDSTGIATWYDPLPSLSGSFWTIGGNSISSIQNIGTTTNFALPFITNNVERMRILTNGNVGIGTVSPTALLEIAGQVKITGGTPGVGKVLTSDATGLASWMTPTLVTSSETLALSGALVGTPNYIAKYTPTGTGINNSQIYDNGTNIGIGTITP